MKATDLSRRSLHYHTLIGASACRRIGMAALSHAHVPPVTQLLQLNVALPITADYDIAFIICAGFLRGMSVGGFPLAQWRASKMEITIVSSML